MIKIYINFYLREDYRRIMNDREITFYLLGVLGDSTKMEALDALKSLTKLSDNEINEIFNEIDIFNESMLNKHHE